MATFEIHTDLDPQALSAVGLEIYRMWVDYAMGRTSINGYKIQHPTGRYANSITYREDSTSKITIMSDGSEAPEGQWIEGGHESFDLKKSVQGAGRTVPMPRGAKTGVTRRGYQWKGGGYGPTNEFGKPAIWAKTRSQGNTGYATIPSADKPGVDPASWIIPAMPAYSPAQTLADLFRGHYGVGR